MRKIILFLLLSFWAFYAHALNLEEIVWMSEEYAPYNYSENKVPMGITVDVLLEMWKKVGLNKKVTDIQMLPWARSYKTTQDVLGSALFSMTYTDERMKLFKFVGPVAINKNALIAKKAKKLKIASVEDINKLNIGAVRDDVGELLLKERGVLETKIDRTNSAKLLVKKLQQDRVDAISYGFDTARWNMKQEEIDSNEYEMVFPLTEGRIGYAFHNDTPPEILTQLQKALDDLKTEGVVDKIIAKYIK